MSLIIEAAKSIDWVTVVTSVVSAGTVTASLAFFAKGLFKNALDRGLENLKSDLALNVKTRELTMKAHIDFKSAQLAELYGPIYAYLKRGEHLWRQIASPELRVINHDLRDLLIKGNDEIVRLLLSKSHLIDAVTIPQSHLDFVTHVAIYNAYLKTRRSISIRRERHPEAFYPEQFEADIYETTERLKSQLSRLQAEYGFRSADSKIAQ